MSWLSGRLKRRFKGNPTWGTIARTWECMYAENLAELKKKEADGNLSFDEGEQFVVISSCDSDSPIGGITGAERIRLHKGMRGTVRSWQIEDQMDDGYQIDVTIDHNSAHITLDA